MLRKIFSSEMCRKMLADTRGKCLVSGATCAEIIFALFYARIFFLMMKEEQKYLFSSHERHPKINSRKPHLSILPTRKLRKKMITITNEMKLNNSSMRKCCESSRKGLERVLTRSVTKSVKRV